MADPLDKTFSQLIEAAMKAEFAELQPSLAQRVSNRIAASPISNRHHLHNNSSSDAQAAAAGSNPPSETQKEEPSAAAPLIQSIPNIPSQNIQEVKDSLEGPAPLPPPPPFLSIDPLQMPRAINEINMAAAQQPQQAPRGDETHQMYPSPYEINASPNKITNHKLSIEKATPQRSRRGNRTITNPTMAAATIAAGGPALELLKTRAEATKEKNRRAQQRFRHKQKSRLEWLECEVTRLRNLLSEKGIDPGGGDEDTGGAASPAACRSPEHGSDVE